MTRFLLSSLCLFGVLLVALLLREAWPPLHWLGLGHAPLMLTVYVGLRWNEWAGLGFGAAAGVAEAALAGSGWHPGVWGLAACGAVAGLAPAQLDHRDPLIEFGLALAFALVGGALIGALRGAGWGVAIGREGLALAPGAVVFAIVLFHRFDGWFKPPRRHQRT